MFNTRLFFALAIAFTSAAADATIPLRDLPKVRNADWYQGYALGLGEGLAQANATLLSENKALLFCPPEDLSLNMNNYMQMIDEFYSEASKNEKLMSVATVSYALQFKLRKNFPCKP